MQNQNQKAFSHLQDDLILLEVKKLIRIVMNELHADVVVLRFETRNR